MKKTITTIMLAAAVFAFAADESSVAKTLSDLSLDRNVAHKMDAPVSKPGFSYFRFSAADSNPTTSVQIEPGLGIGYRLMVGKGAVDVSANYSSNAGWSKDNDNHLWTLPRVTGLYYSNFDGDQSFYGGLGVGYGAVQKNDQQFEGIVGNATVGAEFFRKAAFRTFAELTVSQAAVARVVSDQIPGPIVEFCLGTGY